MRPRAVPLALLLAMVAAAAPARAGDEDALARAQTLFRAGAQAYEKNDFETALQAFEEAYQASPRPGILFSMAQAHRKQFYVDRRPAHLAEAMRGYKAYIEKLPDGGHRADAAQALVELEALSEKVAGSAPAAAPAPDAAKPKTRLMVSSSAEGAQISLDGSAGHGSPLIQEVAPGAHRVRVLAAGYDAEERKVTAVEGGLVAVDVALPEQPGLISVRGAAGAEVAIDRRPMGILPLRGPLEVSPGRHFLAVTQNGARPYTQELVVVRGERRSVGAVLPRTGQRVAAYTLGVTAGCAVLAGIVFTSASLRQESSAKGFLAASAGGNVSQVDLDAYSAARSNRDVWKTAAFTAYGAGVALGVVGLALYAFDAPQVQTPSARDSAPRPLPSATPLEVSVQPMLWPGGGAGALTGRF